MNQPQADARGMPPPPQMSPAQGAGGYVPPYGPASAYMPPPYTPPVPAAPGNGPTLVALSNLSLFSMAASLVFFGSLTCLGGFLLGMWFYSPPMTPYMNGERDRSLSSQMDSYPQQQAAQQVSQRDPRTGTALAETAKSAFGTFVGGRTPLFLSPLASAAQEAVGQAVETSVNRVGATSHLPISSPPAQGGAPAQYEQEPLLASDISPELRGGYAVQLGEYAAPENAHRLKAQLQALQHVARIVEGRSQEGETLYYVQSGHYQDYGTALEAVSQLASQRIPGAIVVKLPQAQKPSQ